VLDTLQGHVPVLYDCSEDASEDGAHERGDQHGGDQDHAGVLHQSHEGEHTGQ